MNTIKRPRGRPRVRSINFRALWWALHREASAQILYPELLASARNVQLRAYLVKASRGSLERATSTALALKPERRYRP